MSAIVLIVIAILVNNYIENNKKIKYSQSDICTGDGRYNSIILKAISIKYPGSKILEAYDVFSMVTGPTWEVKIGLTNGKIITDDFPCGGYYLVEQCEELRKISDPNPNRPEITQSDIDLCYASIAFFYKNITFCNKINNEHIKNNCLAYPIFDEKSKNGYIKSLQTN